MIYRKPLRSGECNRGGNDLQRAAGSRRCDVTAMVLRGPGAASLDKDLDSVKLHFDPEARMEATPVTEPRRRPRASPLAINAAVIGAILLRDI